MTRFTLRGIIVLSGFLLLASALPAAAQYPAEPAKDEAPTFTATFAADVFSQYVWRGLALSNTSGVVQPSVALSTYGFTLSVWGNADMNQDNDNALVVADSRGGKWNETDITFSYAKEVYPGLTLTGGIISYQFANPPEPLDSLLEAYAGATYVWPYQISTSLSAYREFTHQPGWWLQLDVVKTFPLPWYDMTLDVGGSFGYMTMEANDQFLNLAGNVGDYSALHSGTLTAALKIPVHKHLTIIPKFGLAFPLTSEASRFIEANSWDTNSVHPFGGINFTAAF